MNKQTVFFQLHSEIVQYFQTNISMKKKTYITAMINK